MLKVIGSHTCNGTQMEFGDYLPFKFWCEPQTTNPQLYWRTGDLKSTLLEVGIDKITRQIVSAALILPGHVSNKFPNLNYSAASEAMGYPLIDTGEWPDDGFKDEPNLLQVFTDSTRLLIQISDLIHPWKTFISQGVRFGIDSSGSLSWMLFESMKADNLVGFQI